jgi:hypothetical protein
VEACLGLISMISLSADSTHASKKPPISGAFEEWLKGLEPSTFCMASRSIASSSSKYGRLGALETLYF